MQIMTVLTYLEIDCENLIALSIICELGFERKTSQDYHFPGANC